jgi:hypothetical protein
MHINHGGRPEYGVFCAMGHRQAMVDLTVTEGEMAWGLCSVLAIINKRHLPKHINSQLDTGIRR